MINPQVFGFVQLVHWVSTVTLSVRIDSWRRPLLDARTARMSDMGRILSTTVRSFWRDGNRICVFAGGKLVNGKWKWERWGRLTSGSGHNGSDNLSTSVGLITSILTSCDTLTFLPNFVKPLISKLRTAWSFFFASFIITSSVSYEEDAEEEADLRAARSASDDRDSVIWLFALDWIR